MLKIRSKKVRSAARDEECTLQIAGHCNYRTDTTVLCHVNLAQDKGMATKSSDLSAVFGCSGCHAAIDQHLIDKDDFYFYTSRALVRTVHRLVEKGILKLL